MGLGSKQIERWVAGLMSCPDGSFQALVQRLRMCPASVSRAGGMGEGAGPVDAQPLTPAPRAAAKQLPDIVRAVDEFATANADPATSEILDDPRADDMAPLLYLARCCWLLCPLVRTGRPADCTSHPQGTGSAEGCAAEAQLGPCSCTGSRAAARWP